MKRRLFNLLSGFSLLVGLASVLLTARSFWTSDHLAWLNGPAEEKLHDDDLIIVVARGGFSIERSATHDWNNTRPKIRKFQWETNPRTGYPSSIFFAFLSNEPGAKHFQCTGVELGYSSFQNDKSYGRVWAATFPLPAITLLNAILPAIYLRCRWKRLRAKPGRCLKCGYELRATPDRCPECGAMPDAAG